MNIATAVIETRDLLKRDIIAYLQSVGVTDKELWKKSLEALKSASYHSVRLTDATRKEFKKELKGLNLLVGDEFYYRLPLNFSPRHYTALVEFVKRYEIIVDAEMQAENKLEEKICAEIQEHVDMLGDENYDELGCPDFAVCVYEKNIEVRAFDPGLGEILPKKGRRYVGCQGNIRWEYPLSSLAELERMGRPVIKVAELE